MAKTLIVLLLNLVAWDLAWADRVADPDGTFGRNPVLQGTGGGRANFALDLLASQECWEKAETNPQYQTHRTRGGGHMTYCGGLVGEAVKCFSQRLGLSMRTCNGHCGNGKDWVNCDNGELKACGFTKLDNPDSPECYKPGAVRAYHSSTTDNGKRYGHVEWVCGENKFCGPYRRNPLDEPYPKKIADACWVRSQVAAQ